MPQSGPFITDRVGGPSDITALAGTASVSTAGVGTASVQISGVWVATLIFEGTTDGTTWSTLTAFPVAGGGPVTTTTANGHWQVDVSGMSQFRVRASLFTSGTATVTIEGGQPGSLIMLGEWLGSSAPTVGQKTMANSIPVAFASDQTPLPVSPSQASASQTYSAAASSVATAASATDIFVLSGSGTKTIQITYLSVSIFTTAGSGIAIPLVIVKRSTADTGGTSAVVTAVPHDSTNAAATAVVRSYTANPTLGTAVGNVRAQRFTTQAGAQLSTIEQWSFGSPRADQPIILRGTAEQLCINLSATTITGGLASVDIEWVEV